MNVSCWKGYKQIGMKKKAGKTVTNCIRKNKFSFAEWLNENEEQYQSSNPMGNVWVDTWHEAQKHASSGDIKLALRIMKKAVQQAWQKSPGEAKYYLGTAAWLSGDKEKCLTMAKDNDVIQTGNDKILLRLLNSKSNNYQQAYSIPYSENMYNEDLGEWFGKGPKGSSSGGGWDRYSTTGKKLGKCGDRKSGEGKPKCLSKSAAAKLRAKGGAKEIGKAVRRKKRKDPNPEREGKPKNVNSESLLQKYVMFIENVILEKNEPTNKKLWASARAAAGRKYKIKNSAYKNGYAVQWYNKRGGGWKTVKESTEPIPVLVGTMRRPAVIRIRFGSGNVYDYMLREEHDLDYYMNIYRNKLKRNAGLLVSLLKKHKVPFEKM